METTARHKIAHAFQTFNTYAYRAANDETTDADPLVWAVLAVAFEISQFRYQLSKQGSENGGHHRT